jgi:hypothetical protein
MTTPSDKSQQDTPGRPRSSSSRQQTQPNQGTQTGSREIDAESKDNKTPEKPVPDLRHIKYRDRPQDEGKHGDGGEEPNAGFPSRK